MATEENGMVLYWRPDCTYCMKLRFRLVFTHLRYTKVSIWRNPEAAAFVRSVANGNETVPTVTVGGTTMVNPSKRQLMEAVEQHAPHLLRTTEPHQRLRAVLLRREGIPQPAANPTG